MVRTPCCDKNGLKKGTWTPEEDMKLKAYVTRYGCWNWRQLPKYAGLSRCGKSCRLRWLNYLRPNIRRGNFSKEEEDIIVQLHESLGNRWSAIAAKLPGRTDNEVKNHWHTYLKKISKQTSTSNVPKSSSEVLSQQKDKLEKISKEANSSSTNISDDQMFQMSPLSSESSSSVTDAAQVNLRNLAENEVASWEVFEDPSGSFWTEPFLEDNYNTQNDFMGPLVFDVEFMSPNSPIVGEEFLWSYGLHDEQNNTLN